MKYSPRNLLVLWTLLASVLFGCGGDDSASSSVPLTQFSLPGGTTLELVRIESGSFTMGSPDTEVGRSSHEGPLKRVTLTKPFLMGRFEVTQAQWEGVMGTRPWEGREYTEYGDLYPAVFVSWNEVQAFLSKLNSQHSGSVFRLPTEAEWEYACRAGTVTPWSSGEDETDLKDYAWYFTGLDVLGGGHPREVGKKRANPRGLHDMHGNVRELVQDWYFRRYPFEGDLVDPTGPAIGEDKVVRGGYWRDEAMYVRSAMRFHQPPGDWISLVGFRVVREIDEQ